MSSRVLLALFSISLVAACEPTGTAAPIYKQPSGLPKDVLVMSAASPRVLIENAGADVKQLPLIRVVGSYSGTPAGGITVNFNLISPAGDTTVVPVQTSSTGYATLPSWHIGSGIGQYRAIAQLEGGNAVDFNAYVRGQIIAIYDLISVDGVQIPGPDTSQGHYVLFEGRTYNHVYNAPVDFHSQFTTIDGTYGSDSLRNILFYIDPSIGTGYYAFGSSVFATGYASGDTLKVTYSDWLDFSDEVYTHR
jgi:hypothetical protein